jgi:hypothetical protein
MKTIILMAVVATFMGTSVQADIVAAWDFSDAESNSDTSWTTWSSINYTNGTASPTVGGLTLENTSFTFKNNENKGPDFEYQADPALLVPTSDGVQRDWFDMNGDQVLTLTGLTPDQEYRFQFLGTTQQKDVAKNRNITMTLDDAGGTTADLHADGTAFQGNQWYAGYSQYFTFTATAGDTDMVMTFSETGGGKKGLSGLIVEAVPEPATLGLFACAGIALVTRRRTR